MYKKLNKDKLKQRKHCIILSKKGLGEFEPIKWQKEIIERKQKIEVKGC